MVPALAGSLSSFGPVHVLRLLQAARATGRLELLRGRERADLWLEQGRSVYARTEGSAVRVGEMLLRRGDLSREVLELAVAMQKDLPGERIGRMLVHSGAISEDQLRDALLALQRQVLCGVLLWRDGTFRFITGERLPEEEVRLALGSDLDLERMIRSVLELAEEPPESGDKAA